MGEEIKHKKNRTWKYIMYAGITLLVIFFVTCIILSFNTERLLKEKISELVYEKTDSTYLLDIDKLSISFFSKNIEISNISFVPDSIHQADSTNTYYSFTSKNIKISNIKPYLFLRERRLVAESFTINSPKLLMNSGDEISFNAIERQTYTIGDTLKIPFFEELLFDTLKVTNAQLNIDSALASGYKLPQVNLVANHFKLGGRKFSPTPYPFDVSDLLLCVNDLDKILPDSIHKVSVKEINLSLLNSTIKATEVCLKPISDTLKTIDNNYTISIHEVLCKSQQISQFAFADTIQIEKMLFKNPDINIKFGTKIKKGTPLNKIDFYKLTGNKLKWINVKKFGINNANVKFIPSYSNNAAQEFNNLAINFFDFKIDSNSYRDSSRILSAKNMDLNLSTLTLNHTDNVHILTINNLSANTLNNIISTGEVIFTPQKEHKYLNTLVDVSCDGFSCKNVDFLKFYHQKELPMQELIIEKSDIAIEYKRTNKIKHKGDKSIILEKTKDYLTGIYVQKTIINNGRISYKYSNLKNKGGDFETGYSFELTNLSVDSATFYKSDKIFFADDFYAKFHDIKLQLADNKHQLTTSQFQLSSNNKSAEIIDLKIIPNRNRYQNDSICFANNIELINLEFPQIKLSGADLHQAFFNKKLYINNFTVFNPIINIEKYGKWNVKMDSSTPYQNAIYSMVSAFMSTINISKLNMKDGTLNLCLHKKNKPDFSLSNDFSARLTNFIIEENASEKHNKLLFSDDIDLILKDHSFTLADGIHKLDAKEIGILSSEKRLYIKNGNLYPDILSPKFSSTPISIFADIPEMQITGANIFNLFNDGNLPVDNITLLNPHIKLLFQDIQNKEEHSNSKSKLPTQKLNFILANQINIENSFLELANYKNNKSKTFANSKLNFQLTGFKIEQNKGKFDQTYGNFSFTMNDFNFLVTDDSHTIKVKTIKYNLANETLALNNIALSPTAKAFAKEKQQYINVDIPELKITDLDLKNYFKTGKMAAKSLNALNPKVKITDNRIETKTNFSPYNLDLHTKINKGIKALTINEIKLNNGEIDIERNKQIQIKNIDIIAKNFIIDEQNTNSGKLLNSEKITISSNNLNGYTKEKYFRYNINKITLTDEGNFSITGLSLKPTLSAKEFAKRKKYQNDYFYIENCDITGTNFNIKEFIKNQTIYIPELTANFNNVKIHRDKTYPLPDEIKKLPQEALRDLKTKINIKKAYVTVDNFKYLELEKGALRNGVVTISNGKAQINNITNIRQDLQYNPYIDAHIQGKIMDIGETHIDMKLNVKSLGNEFTVNAVCHEMPLTALNSITEPNMRLSIKNGINKNMEVNFDANEDIATGYMWFAYKDLKISVLNNKDGEIKEGKFLSFLVNTLALKSDNIKPGGRVLIPVKFEKKRDKQRSMVGYCWQSIFTGIKATLGLKNKENKTEQADNNN